MARWLLQWPSRVDSDNQLLMDSENLMRKIMRKLNEDGNHNNVFVEEFSPEWDWGIGGMQRCYRLAHILMKFSSFQKLLFPIQRARNHRDIDSIEFERYLPLFWGLRLLSPWFSDGWECSIQLTELKERRKLWREEDERECDGSIWAYNQFQYHP